MLDGEESALSALGRPSRPSVSVLCTPSDCGLISKAVGNKNGPSLTPSTAAPRGADTTPLIRASESKSFVNALLPFPTHTPAHRDFPYWLRRKGRVKERNVVPSFLLLLPFSVIFLYGFIFVFYLCFHKKML